MSTLLWIPAVLGGAFAYVVIATVVYRWLLQAVARADTAFDGALFWPVTVLVAIAFLSVRATYNLTNDALDALPGRKP